MSRRGLAGALLLGLALAAAAEPTVLEVIPLRHRLLQEVLPVLQPLVGEGGAVTGMNDQLVIRATPANLAELKRVLADLDRPYRRLRISVRQSVAGTLSGAERAYSGALEGEQARAALPDPGGGGAALELRSGELSARLRAEQATGALDSENVHVVQTLEGQPALIYTGLSIPYPEDSVVVLDGEVVVNRANRYREVSSGLYVVPYLVGDRVTLRVSPRLERPAGAAGVVDTQRLETTVSGELGQWLELGAALDQSVRAGATAGASGEQNQASRRSLWVRVDELP